MLYIIRFFTVLRSIVKINLFRYYILGFMPILWTFAVFNNFIITQLLTVLYLCLAFIFSIFYVSILHDIINRNIYIFLLKSKENLISSKKITLLEAYLFLFLFLFLQFFCLFQIAIYLIKWAIVLDICILYCFFKQFSNFSYLSVSFLISSGILFSSLAFTSGFPYSFLLLYIGASYWIYFLFGLYSHDYDQKANDIKKGIKSLSVVYGKDIKIALYSYLTIGVIFFIAFGFFNFPRMNIYYFVMITISYLFYIKEIQQSNLSASNGCQKLYSTSILWAFFYFFCIILGKLIIA